MLHCTSCPSPQLFPKDLNTTSWSQLKSFFCIWQILSQALYAWEETWAYMTWAMSVWATTLQCRGSPEGWDVAHEVWLSQPSVTAANPEILACNRGCGTQQTRTGLHKHICRQGLVHPASSAGLSSWAKRGAMLTGCQGRLCIISTIHFLSWTSA